MAPRQMLNQLVEAGSVIEIEGRYKAVRRDFKHSKLTPELIERLGRVGYRVFSTAAKNIDKEANASGHFDRMVSADDGCTDEVLDEVDEYIKSRGQQFLEEIDVWFSSRKDKIRGADARKETGLYMVHYVEDEDELGSLRALLSNRGLDREEKD